MPKKKFTKAIKAKWIAAMESGRYIQAYGTLKSIIEPDKPGDEPKYAYCALGVLEDIVPCVHNGYKRDFDKMTPEEREEYDEKRQKREILDPYEFLNMTLGDRIKGVSYASDVYLANDTSGQLTGHKGNFAEVIEVVKSLPTQD